ncbi:hypothetical protein [Actinoallomurus sp. NPDC050550]|uniref:hypothetical protein n=1 Tax=Actinoallomurus sp. NPDC050550 TaxID=3154937 RepID=UPI0033C46B88
MTIMRISSARIAAIAGCTAVIAVFGAPASYADHQFKGSGLPDNKTQDFQGHSLTAKGTAAMKHGKQQLERSKITTKWGSGDIHFFDGKYGNTGWFGQTRCEVRNGPKCGSFSVHFNQSAMGSRSTSAWESLGCHEVGHTGDLGHRKSNKSCMIDGNSFPRNYDSHDIWAINKTV